MKYEVQFKDYHNGTWHTEYEGTYDEMFEKLYEHREQHPLVVSRLVQVHVVLEAKSTGTRVQDPYAEIRVRPYVGPNREAVEQAFERYSRADTELTARLHNIRADTEGNLS
jgi:hypothetical protein